MFIVFSLNWSEKTLVLLCSLQNENPCAKIQKTQKSEGKKHCILYQKLKEIAETNIKH